MNGNLFLALRVVSTAVDLSLGLGVLSWLARRAGTWPFLMRLSFALAAALLALLVKLPLWVPLGLRLFGVVHLGFVHLIVVPPLLALAALVIERRHSGRVGRRLAVAVTLSAATLPAVGAYATLIEPFDLRLETTAIQPARRRLSTPVRIGVLADIQTAHVTAHEQHAVDMVLAQAPDIIVLPGDLFHGAHSTLKANLGELRALMSRLHAPGGVYFVLGDADTADEAAAIFGGSGVKVLVNQAHRTMVKGQAVTIAGVDLDWRSRESVAFLHMLEVEPEGDDLRIVVAHRPDVVLDLPARSRVDLVIAGHTHGGQVKLPLFGPPITLSHVPRAVGGGGYHQVGGHGIYVSRGVGYEGGQAPRIRFLCPPEVSLLVIGGAEGGVGDGPRS